MQTTTMSPWTRPADAIDELVQALGADADARSAELYRARRIPSDLHRAVTDSGVFRQLVPTELYGTGRTPLDWFRTGIELARHDASIGWVATQGAAELGWIAAGADEGWAREVLADPLASSASSVAGLGRLSIDAGRYRLSGRWAFNSGCHGATWIGGLAIVHQESVEPTGPVTRFGWVPAEQAQIVETWDPSGLHGTGSHTTVIEEVEIPAEWTFDPFSPTTNDRGPYRSLVGNGNWPIATSVAATQLGNARRALDVAADIVMTKAPMPDFAPLASNHAVQRSLAELEGGWLGAVAGVERELVSMWEQASAEGALSIDQRVRLHRANLAANRYAVAALQRLVEITGTETVDRSGVLARCQRDALALSGHISVGGSALEHNTQVALGLEPAHRLV